MLYRFLDTLSSKGSGQVSSSSAEGDHVSWGRNRACKQGRGGEQGEGHLRNQQKVEEGVQYDEHAPEAEGINSILRGEATGHLGKDAAVQEAMWSDMGCDLHMGLDYCTLVVGLGRKGTRHAGYAGHTQYLGCGRG